MKLSKMLDELTMLRDRYPDDDPDIDYLLKLESDIVNDDGDEFGTVELSAVMPIMDIIAGLGSGGDHVSGVLLVSKMYGELDDI